MQSNQIEFDAREQAAFSLFRQESTDSYKRFVIRLVYENIASDNGITINKLKAGLQRSLSIDPTDVDAAIASLSNERLFDCVSRFEVPVNRMKQTSVSKNKSKSGGRSERRVNPTNTKPTHLRTKPLASEFWYEWLTILDKNNPNVTTSSMLLAR